MTATFDGETYPQTICAGGQNLYKFEDAYIFVLENDVYRTAGYQHWENRMNNDGWRSQGIGLNTRIARSVYGDAEREFYVYDSKNNRCFRLEERSKAVKNRGVEKKGTKEINVLPLECFSENHLEKVPDELKRRY